MSNLRRLRALILPKSKERRNPGKPPEPILLRLSQLRINDDYQRALSRDSTRLASKVAIEFDWELFHLPVVSPIGENDDVSGLPLYEVLDGQHTAIAATSNGHIHELWCWPGRKDETVESRASSFRKLNTQRTAVTPVELFWASVTEQDENALEIVEACRNSGASIVKRPKPYGNMEVGETICVAPLTRLAEKGGRPYVQRVLKICMDLRLAPITQFWILAFEELLFKPNGQHHIEGVPSVVDLEIVNAINRIGLDNLLRQAKINNTTASAKDRESIYWWMANHIKLEMRKHATSR